MILKNVQRAVYPPAPPIVDTIVVPEVDEDGDVYPSFVSVDNAAIVRSNGDVSLYSLKALLNAGVNPDTGIATTFPVRLGGFDSLQQFAAEADSIVADSQSSKTE